jgi:hypothetical protein
MADIIKLIPIPDNVMNSWLAEKLVHPTSTLEAKKRYLRTLSRPLPALPLPAVNFRGREVTASGLRT